jgi:hypothetical protein
MADAWPSNLQKALTAMSIETKVRQQRQAANGKPEIARDQGQDQRGQQRQKKNEGQGRHVSVCQHQIKRQRGAGGHEQGVGLQVAGLDQAQDPSGPFHRAVRQAHQKLEALSQNWRPGPAVVEKAITSA